MDLSFRIFRWGLFVKDLSLGYFAWVFRFGSFVLDLSFEDLSFGDLSFRI